MFEKIILKSKEDSEPLAAVMQMYLLEKTHSDNIIDFEKGKNYYILIDMEFFDYAAYAFSIYLTENICLFFTIDLISDFDNELSDIEKELLAEAVHETLNSTEGEEFRIEITKRLISFSKEYNIISIEGFTKFAINDCVEGLVDMFCDSAFSFIMYDRFYYIDLIDALRSILKNKQD